MKELKNKFDMGFNKINHKIDMKVKKDCQVIVSLPIGFSMLCPDPLFSAISSCNESTYCSDSNSWTYKSTQHLLEVSVLRMAPSDTNSVSSWVTCGKKTPRSEVVFRNSTHPVTRPNAVRILYLCQSDFLCSVQIRFFRKFRRVMS
jgi:hypothetical protein